MTFEEIDKLIEDAKAQQRFQDPHLLARQISSNSRPDLYYTFLQTLFMRTLPVGVFLEIGCYHGCTAAHLTSYKVKVRTESLYMGIDINPVPYADAGAIILQGDSNDPAIVDRVRRVGEAAGGIFAVFQDSSHHYMPSVVEWNLYSTLVRPGGIWVADDITPAFYDSKYHKTMVDYWNQIPFPEDRKRLYNNLHHGSTMGIVLL